ncbi:PglZ domain [Slackia heliotrinireducens]|uniref:Uncharacterized protein n=1 Tax=Slackia heliotrinireducens (strain ATCC 29202 / DSM 20476 / NCTC 11029 / RHS 1) TaxID=471855 RepID=C7N257_SLAHD|nr:BREX-1 system phosphatase PglZ type A [Slackia heliotrinireducens]ACV21363.1 conserved hypothetical protein TIGR02687 [Slackia heliotrinireducens DSM 20476]VEG98795.1 PglZ domain [Slackia heliotrinireducens]
MDIEYSEIENRLKAAFGHSTRLVFWEDESSEYADSIEGLKIEGADIVDATGHELATKRTILREQPGKRFVVYRHGGAPNPADDLLLDVKIAARPFSCSMEGVWADECGIPVTLAGMLADHAAFFNSKERRAALAATSLPKSGTQSFLFAMAAATMKAADAEERDAARSMAKKAVLEWARGDEQSMRMLVDAGLSGTFWAAMREHIGYRVGEGDAPNAGDLAFRLLEGMCGPIVQDDMRADDAEASRILGDLARDGRTRDEFDRVVQEYSKAVAALVPQDMRTAETLSEVDAIPEIDEWILSGFAAEVSASSTSSAAMERVRDARKHSLYHYRYGAYYSLLIAITGFRSECARYKKECGSGTGTAQILEKYCSAWHLVDRRYREAHLAFDRVPAGRFKSSMTKAMDELRGAYDLFLVDLTDRWQMHLMDDGAWPPSELPSQSRFFREHVELALPRAERGKRVGVIVSDALRYEAGSDLASRLSASKLKGIAGRAAVKCAYALSAIPSYTQLGMAALLPDGAMEIDPATTYVRKAGAPTWGTANRGKIISARIPGAVALQAKDVMGTKLDLSDAPVAVVYHNVIDKTGDTRDTEGDVFEAVERACAEIEKLVQALIQSGCGKVVITSDHGFIYQSQNPETYAYVDVPGLSQLKSADDVSCDHTRRFVVGKSIPKSESLVEYAAVDLSLEGDYNVAFPKGVTRLRLSGSGSRFVHGGASLQENVVPVITVEAAKGAKASRPTGVEGFVIGRPVVTGPSVSVTVYQSDPCSESVSPQTVKVGVYSKDGALVSATEKTIELASESDDVETRKTRVTMPLIDEVDDCASVVVRISARIGNTNAYESAWEQEYSVNRAFGMDF